MAITDVVTAAIDKSVAKVARAARHALERITPGEAPKAEATPAPRPTRKSKGWRRHVRAEKARQGASKG